MDSRTRHQLLELSRVFYDAHAEAFDASRGHQAWPGWQRLIEWLPEPRDPTRPDAGAAPLRVLDIGCGNARFARFLHDAGYANGGDKLEYLGLDANAALLEAARARLDSPLAESCSLLEHDFLAGETPGEALPTGPFDVVALMGVLHHVPGADWRLALLRAAADRTAPGGLLALATWQFAGRPRFAKRTVDWASLGPVLGEPLAPDALESGDYLLRFGEDPSAPLRYCHQVSDAEFETWPSALGLEPLADYRADGAAGDLNRYRVMRKR